MTKKEDSSEIREFPRESIPVVFMFRPTHYRVIPNQRLKEWEESFRKRIGLEGVTLEGVARGAESESWCGPEPVLSPYPDDIPAHPGLERREVGSWDDSDCIGC